jgi:hypothetical protein
VPEGSKGARVGRHGPRRARGDRRERRCLVPAADAGRRRSRRAPGPRADGRSALGVARRRDHAGRARESAEFVLSPLLDGGLVLGSHGKYYRSWPYLAATSAPVPDWLAARRAVASDSPAETGGTRCSRRRGVVARLHAGDRDPRALGTALRTRRPPRGRRRVHDARWTRAGTERWSSSRATTRAPIAGAAAARGRLIRPPSRCRGAARTGRARRCHGRERGRGEPAAHVKVARRPLTMRALRGRAR